MTHPRTRPYRDATAALLYLAVQAALITGIPLALWKLSGNPIPQHRPNWDLIQEQWRGIETQPAQIIYPLLTAAVDLLWIVWAWYTAWAMIAALWTLLRLPRTVLPNALAAVTPAVAFRALSLSAVVASPTLHPVPAASAPAPVHPATPRSEAQAASTTATAAVHVVEPGENLWDIAGHYYHQPEAWHRIYQANKGIIQADGRSLKDPDLMLPGWRLAIPTATGIGSAATTPPQRPATGPGAPTRATAPAAPHTAATAPHTPPFPRPAATGPARTDRPHTVGYALPNDAGYIGITLITAVAAAVAILRTRNRYRHHPRDENIPELAEHLAAVHSAAQSASLYTWRQDEHLGEQPPPLYVPGNGPPTIATSPDGRHEMPFDPETMLGQIGRAHV